MNPESDTTRRRQERLLYLFQSILSTGGAIVPVSAVDQKVAQLTSAFFLKHDVHDLSLNSLTEFARHEINLGVRATYFFMPRNHPRTQKAYSFYEQIRTMREIEAMGHELGLHIDPYFQMHQNNAGLARVMDDILADFHRHGIDLKLGNMHGNSQFKHSDVNGFGTSFDLFDEVRRQPDFPRLADVPKKSAEIVRENRISLIEFGFSHWADMPMWSAENGFVGTNFLSDNNLGKKGSLEVVLREATTGRYYISKSQPPGSRNLAVGGQTIFTNECGKKTDRDISQSLDFFSEDLTSLLSVATDVQPLLMLIHPEFYC